MINSRLAALLCATTFLLTGCVYSSIDARKTGVPRTESSVNKNVATQLTDKDIFGNETTLAVSEEDIQAALEGEKFSVPLNSAVILVQSGSRAPEMTMQQEMGKYYKISTFSGIPDRQKPLSCNRVKTEEGDAVVSENMNYMQALRYIAAKGQQKAVIVYWDTLQTGRYDDATKATLWSDYRGETLSGSASLRYLIRFALVDVATGEWATWSPINYEYSILQPLTGKKPVSMTEPQIAQFKQKTYAAVVKDLVNRYQ
ncbi:hypothetical protein O8H62_001277 [Enterobacter asburiae]|jgi:hypothetical protein|nr:hypothetical protein [Enterobacter asburiae]HBH7067780.1 hypothetical protein [Enterobacter cloacae]